MQNPEPKSTQFLNAGQVGYIIVGMRTTSESKVGGTLFVEGDGSATVKANGGVVLAATAAGRGFIVSTGTITFTPSATETGATTWDIWYMPIDDGAAVS